jgi:hypothetical protein
MPNFSVLVDVPAGGVIANAFAGSAFEFLGRASRVRIAATVIAAGISSITATIQFGPEVQLEEGAINVEPGVGFGPRLPDNILVDDVGAPGDRLVMRLTNSDGAAAHNVRILASIIPIA